MVFISTHFSKAFPQWVFLWSFFFSKVAQSKWEGCLLNSLQVADTADPFLTAKSWEWLSALNLVSWQQLSSPVGCWSDGLSMLIPYMVQPCEYPRWILLAHECPYDLSTVIKSLGLLRSTAKTIPRSHDKWVHRSAGLLLQDVGHRRPGAFLITAALPRGASATSPVRWWPLGDWDILGTRPETTFVSAIFGCRGHELWWPDWNLGFMIVLCLACLLGLGL